MTISIKLLAYLRLLIFVVTVWNQWPFRDDRIRQHSYSYGSVVFHILQYSIRYCSIVLYTVRIDTGNSEQHTVYTEYGALHFMFHVQQISVGFLFFITQSTFTMDKYRHSQFDDFKHLPLSAIICV